MTGSRMVAVVACGSALFTAAAATAGAPKAQRLAHISVDRHSNARATLAAGSQRISVVLAQIAVNRELRLGKSCKRVRGDRAVTDVALELGLGVSARVANEPKAERERAAYVYQPEGRGSFDSAKRSLNYLLVLRGIAKVSAERGSIQAPFRQAQRRAKGHHRGIWGCR